MIRNLWILGLAIIMALVVYDGRRRIDEEGGGELGAPPAKKSSPKAFSKKVAKFVVKLTRQFKRRAQNKIQLLNIEPNITNATKGDLLK